MGGQALLPLDGSKLTTFCVLYMRQDFQQSVMTVEGSHNHSAVPVGKEDRMVVNWSRATKCPKKLLKLFYRQLAYVPDVNEVKAAELLGGDPRQESRGEHRIVIANRSGLTPTNGDGTPVRFGGCPWPCSGGQRPISRFV
jgi:hypothetical protein